MIVRRTEGRGFSCRAAAGLGACFAALLYQSRGDRSVGRSAALMADVPVRNRYIAILCVVAIAILVAGVVLRPTKIPDAGALGIGDLQAAIAGATA